MDILGIAEEVTRDGRIIVRCATTPDAGDPVFDHRNRKIGTIKRIFGPVDEPYASVKMEDKTSAPELKGKTLHYTRGDQNGKGKRRNRRY